MDNRIDIFLARTSTMVSVSGNAFGQRIQQSDTSSLTDLLFAMNMIVQVLSMEKT